MLCCALLCCTMLLAAAGWLAGHASHPRLVCVGWCSSGMLRHSLQLWPAAACCVQGLCAKPSADPGSGVQTGAAASAQQPYNCGMWTALLNLGFGAGATLENAQAGSVTWVPLCEAAFLSGALLFQ